MQRIKTRQATKKAKRTGNKEEEKEKQTSQTTETETESEKKQQELIEKEEKVVFGTKRTRHSYIALIVVVLSGFVFILFCFIWSLRYAGCSAASEEQQQEQGPKVISTVTSSSSSGGNSSAKIKILGNELISVGTEPGLHWIGLNQGISSTDGTKILYLAMTGELFLDDMTNPDQPQNCWRSDTANQDGFRFVLSSDGNGYILRSDSSRVYFGAEYVDYVKRKKAGEILPEPEATLNSWLTPNCRREIYRNCDTSGTVKICGSNTTVNYCFQSAVTPPYFLRFNDKGLELVSISNLNKPTSYQPSSNYVLYPELKSDSQFPVPMWVQECPLVLQSKPPPPDKYKNLNSSEVVGPCPSCSTLAL